MQRICICVYVAVVCAVAAADEQVSAQVCKAGARYQLKCSPYYCCCCCCCCRLLQAALARFKLWCTPPAVPPRPAKRPAAALCESGQLPVFRNGRALRDYQVRHMMPSRTITTRFQPSSVHAAGLPPVLQYAWQQAATREFLHAQRCHLKCLASAETWCVSAGALAVTSG
jgi:hypothetical protein